MPKLKSPIEREADKLQADGYTVIAPKHNALKELLIAIGKADLSSKEVEELCQTAKMPGLDGFTRIDLLPCGCLRIYKGMIAGVQRFTEALKVQVTGLEGVKPCQSHVALVGLMRRKNA